MAEICITKNMAMTQRDFLRLLPLVFPSGLYQVYQDRVDFEDLNRKLCIRFFSMDTLKIGAIEMPQLQLNFVFSGYQPAETEFFIKRFNAVYHRGGG